MNGETSAFIIDGLVVYPHMITNQKDQTKKVEEIIPSFPLFTNTFSLFFYGGLTESSQKAIRSFRGKKTSSAKLEEIAKHRTLGKPLLQYDKTLLKVETEGNFLNGGLLEEKNKKKLGFKVTCLDTKNAFVEIDLPIVGSKQRVQVMFRRMCGDQKGCSLISHSF